MAMVRKVINVNQDLTEEQINEIEKASNSPVVIDEDSPELSENQIAQISKLVKERNEEQKMETVSLRLSKNKLKTIKKFGKGYTAILRKIIESVLSDEEALKKYVALN